MKAREEEMKARMTSLEQELATAEIKFTDLREELEARGNIVLADARPSHG